MSIESKNDWNLRLVGIVGLVYLLVSCAPMAFIRPFEWSHIRYHPYDVVFSWTAVAAAVVSAVQAMFLARSKFRMASLMWLCAIGWLAVAVLGTLPLLPSKVWVPRGGFPGDWIFLALMLLQSSVFFVLKSKNRGAFSNSLLFLALVPFLHVAEILELAQHGPKLFIFLTDLVRLSFLTFAYFTFAFHPAEPATIPSSGRRLRAAAVLGVVYASCCCLNAFVFRVLSMLQSTGTPTVFNVKIGIGILLSLVFCISFLLLLLSGRRAAVWGLVGIWLMLVSSALLPHYLHCPFYYSYALRFISFGLIIVSFVLQRDLFPVWGRWCIAVWSGYAILQLILGCVSVLLYDYSGQGVATNPIRWILATIGGFYPLCSGALLAAYIGMLCRHTEP